MGQEIATDQFTQADFDRFEQRLRRETTALAAMFQQGTFCNAGPVGGLELEAWLVGGDAQPVPGNQEFLDQLQSDDVVPELSKFNFEINVEPQALSGPALRLFGDSLERRWQACRSTANRLGMDVMTIGIHPQLRDSQLTLQNMSAGRRYRALNEQVLKQRGRSPIALDIQGRERLTSKHYDVMLEAATTSFQIHLKVSQQQAVRAYNAAQIVSAPLLAVGANAPYVFGKDLWDESRIPLFEQAVNLGRAGRQRVTLGESYAKHSLLECFEENLAHYPVLIPAQSDEAEETLPYLRLHNGTIWRWNRPLLGFNDAGVAHLRIENRVLPAGPTIADMMANAAFFWGLIAALLQQDIAAEQSLPFAAAKQNFYNAVQQSLGCRLQWLDGRTHACTDLLRDQLLPLARAGLDSLQIDPQDAEHYLGIIAARLAGGRNGAAWQRAFVAKHGRDMQQLSRVYLQNQHSGQPVHLWEV